ncbi:MAG: HAD family phosphatase [Patescibacteria group bacterium]
MIKAIAFDLDGVLIDSEPLWERSTWEYVKNKCGTTHRRQFRSRDLDREVRGRTQRYISTYLKRHLSLPDSPQQIVKDRLQMLFDLFNKRLTMAPGGLALLKLLKKSKYPVILASSSPRRVIDFVMRRFLLKKYFVKIISGDDMKYSKPHPWVYKQAAKILHVKPAEMLVIEDSISGVQAGLKSGARVIAMKKPYTPKKYTKDAIRVIKSLNQLSLEQIQRL